MMNRRQFIYAAAGAAIGVRRSEAFAPEERYELVIKGGRIIDPSRQLDGVRDVAIAGGRIAAIKVNIPSGNTATIDATGKLVVPGLIDIHTHAARDAAGPALCLADGVTGWIDAGSQGADHIADTVTVARSAPQQGRVLVNIGRAGILTEGDTMNLANADVAAARNAIAANRDFVVGVKARLSRDVAGPNDFEVLKRAQEAASTFNLPVMIHMGQTNSPLSKLLPLLKRGDIVTHMFAPPPNSIVDDNGHILPEVLAARRRGVWFDVGNGVAGHLRWDVADQVIKEGFWPDTFSTDWNVNSPKTGVIDFANCMSKFFNYGMTISQIVSRATLNPSRVFPVFNRRGTLAVGAPADVALLEHRTGQFEFLDNYQNKRQGQQRLFPVGTVFEGKPIQRHQA
jgi:dihydroorotase